MCPTRAAQPERGAVRRDNVIIGTEAGLNLTTGVDNILLGRTAGKALTTGGNNCLVGGYTAEDSPGLDGNCVLSTPAGAVCARWDRNGNPSFRVNARDTVSEPVERNSVAVVGFPNPYVDMRGLHRPWRTTRTAP